MKKETLREVATTLGNGYKCYVNKATEEVHGADSLPLNEQKSTSYQEYMPLAGDVTFGLMQDFIATVDDFEKQSELLEAISFEQPFKSFKTKVYRIGLADSWIAYRTERIEELIK